VKCYIFCRDGVWWLDVPRAILFASERRSYHRRTFREAIRLMDGYIARARVPRAVRPWRQL
jgi:hypothetical protein